MMMETALTQFKKHFPCWAYSLITYGIESEKPIAKVVADFLLGNLLDWTNEEVYMSEVHKRCIDLGAFISCLTATCT